MSGPDATVALPSQPRRLADRFVLLRLLARGGMGTVYEAHDETLGRAVAIKLLRSHDDHLAVERFRREAHAVAGLDHPGIVTLYDHGVDGEQHYLVMELVDGRDLASLLHERGHLPPARALRVAAEVAEGLQHAHDAGVVHRDIKPANILIDRDGRARLTDFGVARMTDAAAVTTTGTMIGTARYCAPEQVTGEPVGPAADVYATGAVLYEMLTGRPPFDGDHPSAVAVRRLTEPFPTPSQARAGLPPAVDAVVARATAHDANDRFPTAGAFARALQASTRHVADPTIAGTSDAPTRPTSAPEPTQPLWRPGDPQRRRTIAGAAVLLLIAGVLLAAVTASGRSTADDPPPPPDADRADPPASTRPAPTRPSDGPRATDGPAAPSEDTSFEIVPGIIGLDGERVAARLRHEGFRVELVPRPADEPEGTVVDTEPPVGDHVRRGDAIVLHVAAR